MKSLNCKGKLLTFDQPKVIGILNITDDSFFDGGQYASDSEIVNRAAAMLEEGAAIIDVGAQSSRPGSEPIATQVERDKIESTTSLLLQEFPNAIISIDTYRSAVAKAGLDAGAAIINDISGGNEDEQMFSVIREYQVPYIIMHMQGTPATMQHDPSYEDVVGELHKFFSAKIEQLTLLGVNDIVLDPGFGFGKTVEHNYEILNHLDSFSIWNRPLLAGISRKSMINRVLKTKPEEALNGTTAAHMMCLEKGANILRVHDVAEAIEAINIYTFAQSNS